VKGGKMNLSAKKVQDYIHIVLQDAYPRTLTHAEAAYEIKRTKGFDNLY
jgi:hypothetical protein